MKVNIYLETDKQNQECTWRKYGYVKGMEPETRTEPG